MTRTHHRIVLASRPGRPRRTGAFPARAGAHSARRRPARSWSAITSCRSIRTCVDACRSRSRTPNRRPSVKRWSAVRSASSRHPITRGLPWATPSWACSAGRNTGSPMALASTRSMRDVCRCRPTWGAGHAGRHRLVWPEQDLHSEAGRDGPGIGRQRCRRVGGGPAREDRRLPCRRHRWRAREMQLRPCRTRLRCVPRPS